MCKSKGKMDFGHLLRGTACNEQFRFFAVDSTAIVQSALDLHQSAPAPALLLGRMLTAALLMGADLKEKVSTLTINLETEGMLKGAIAIYEPQGKVRGYAKNPSLFVDVLKENWQIGKLLGSGTLSVIKDLKLKAPITGTIELASGEIAEDIARYYLTSEQIPTAVSLGVLFNREGGINSAGGYLIQQLPSANPADVDKLKINLDNTPYITDLLDMGLDWQKILQKMLFKDMDYSITDTYPVEYYCPCSKERFASALKLLGKDELEAMAEGITPACHYCNKEYEFTFGDISELVKELSK